MENPISHEIVVNSLRLQYGLKVEAPVLNEAISGLDSGMKWVLRKYQKADSPKLMIGEHIGSVASVNGFIETESGEKLIGLQVDELRKLKGMGLSATITNDYGDDVPVKPTLSIKQWYEGFAIEETLHWLQDKGVEGMATLPLQEKKNTTFQWGEWCKIFVTTS